MTDHQTTPTDERSAEPAPHRPGAADRWRRDAYLQRVDWHLEAVVSGRERRSIVRSLREDLTAERRPMTAALADLGSPRALAARYAEDPTRLRPVWSIGVIWGGVAILAYWCAFALFTLGMLSVVEQSTLTEAHARFFFVDVLAFAGPDGIGIGWSGDLAWLLVPTMITSIGVLLGARCWRALPRPRR